MTKKSDLIKQICDGWPNLTRKDVDKFFFIFFNEIKNALKNKGACEIRSLGRFSTKIQKEGIRRNPLTGDKVFVKQKKIIKWKMSQKMFKKINEKA